jgi:hypothetical protein
MDAKPHGWHPTVGILGIPNVDYQARPLWKVPGWNGSLSRVLEKCQESIMSNHNAARNSRAELGGNRLFVIRLIHYSSNE